MAALQNPQLHGSRENSQGSGSQPYPLEEEVKTVAEKVEESSCFFLLNVYYCLNLLLLPQSRQISSRSPAPASVSCLRPLLLPQPPAPPGS